MSVVGILIALGLLVWLAYRGWSILLLAPLCALIAALLAGPGAAGKLDADLHEQRSWLCRTVFPDLSPWRAVRQADGSERFGRGHRQISDRALGYEASHSCHRACGSIRDLWRRQPFCCILRAGAHGPRPVQGCQYTASPDACGHRTRHIDLHNVGDARHARDPERDTDAVFRHQPIRSARPRPDGIGDHARIRPVVVGAGRSRGPARRRGV